MPRIQINCPRQGISQGAHIGFADVRQLDLDTEIGVAMMNKIMTKISTTVVDAQVKWIVRDPVTTDNVYSLDSNGVVYKYVISTNTLTELSDRGGTGQGMAIWKDYLFVAEETTIDIYGPLSGSPAWTDNWSGLTMDTDALWHPMLHSKLDDKLYIGCGRFVATIEELTTFAPGTAATYTPTAQALDLPSSYRIKCLEELGNNLMIGTWKGTNVYDIREATIFIWDGAAVSFSQPIILNEYGVHALLSVGGSMFILAGVSGAVYRTEGGYAYKIAQLPLDISGGRYFEYYPGAIASYKDKIYFGVGNTGLNVSGGAALSGGMGVYSLQTTGKGSIIALEHLNSANTDGSAASVKASAILPITSQTLMMAWRSNTTYGIDLSSATSFAYGTDYSAYFESPLYEVGKKENKFKPKSIELHLGQPLRTGEGIKLEYRTSLAGTWTTIKTLAFADNEVGAMISRTLSITVPENIKECEQLQFRVSLLGTATTSPEFKMILVE